MERIGVVGCGLMGSGIAEVLARAGLNVAVKEISESALEAGRGRIEHSLARAVSRGKMTDDEHAAVRGRIAYTSGWDGFDSVELVIEAVVEDEELKKKLFESLDSVTPRDAILATNTSSVPIMKLASATSRAGQVLGLHFFNPVPVMPLVEIVPALTTADKTLQIAREFVENDLGKKTVMARDRAGFVVNRLLIPYLLDAVRMLESGFATLEDIDQGMVLGCNHPMGPLALSDLIGLDTLHAVARSLFEEFKEPLYAPPPLLSRMVEAGLLGRKSGRGFHDYGR
ncbi:MAG: 3-hydroxybutyryl-CoA dehydrogenase [Actinomycetota bacterium]